MKRLYVVLSSTNTKEFFNKLLREEWETVDDFKETAERTLGVMNLGREVRSEFSR